MQAHAGTTQALYSLQALYKSVSKSVSSSLQYGKEMPFEKLNSCSEKDPLSHLSTEKNIRASKQYGDDLHVGVEKQ